MTQNASLLPDWRELIRLSDSELAKIDIAVMNMACAVGLPGWERMDVAKCLKGLDDWAIGIRDETERTLGTAFRRNPAKYDNSEAVYRMVCLVCDLREYCGVKYNPAKITPKPGNRLRAEDEFIYGAIQGPGGTCASLPVVFTAIARRLGYPVYLVWTKGHAFCRWDDPTTGEKVNIDGTNYQGVATDSDDHYRQWPHPFAAREEEVMGYLRSLSPREELVAFLESRSLVWEGAEDYLQAIDAMVAATEVDHHPYPRSRGRLVWFVRQWIKRLSEQGRIGHGFRYPVTPVEPRRWPGMPWVREAEILWLDAAERGTMPIWAFPWDDSRRLPGVHL